MARRRYQRGCIFKRGKRKKVWVARWREDVIQADGTHGRIHRSAVLGLVSEILTRLQAQALLDLRIRPINQGLQRPQSSMRFRDFGRDKWVRLVLPTLKLSTQLGYQRILGRHLLPYFGDSRLCDISRLDIQQFIAENFRQGVAWQTVRNTWIVLSSILSAAVEYDYLVVNPAHRVKFPPQPPRREPLILTPEAFARLLAQLPEPYKIMVALVALTGLRVGELLALRWRDMDLGSGMLQVAQTVYEGRFQTPKSEKAVRTLPIGPVTRQLLKEHRRRSVRLTPDDLLFPNRRGRPYQARNLLRRVLQPAARAAGITRITWHQFRHIHSSLLHDLGVPAKIAQMQLGHATVETTLNIYTHTIPESHRHAVEDLERLLFPNVPKSVARRNNSRSLIQ